MQTISCRQGCGACCIALSISSAIPGMPNGKPAGLPCIHLDEDYRCKIFLSVDRPAVCANLKPEPEMCCNSREEALIFLRNLEFATDPELKK